MDDNCGDWVELMGVASGCGEQKVGVASGSGWNLWVWLLRGGSRIDLRGGLSIPRALARAKFYVLRPLLTSFPHTTSYTKKK